MGERGEFNLPKVKGYTGKVEDGVAYYTNKKTGEQFLAEVQPGFEPEPEQEPQQQVSYDIYRGDRSAQVAPLTREDDVKISLTMEASGGPGVERVINLISGQSSPELELYRQAFLAQQSRAPELPRADLHFDPEEPIATEPWSILGENPELAAASYLDPEFPPTAPAETTPLPASNQQVDPQDVEKAKAERLARDEEKSRKKLRNTRLGFVGAILAASAYTTVQIVNFDSNAAKGSESGQECAEQKRANIDCIRDQFLADLNPLRERSTDKGAEDKAIKEATEPEKE